MKGLGKARVEPSGPAVAGSRGTWKLIYTVGEEGLAPGGGIRVSPPRLGIARWEPGKVTASTDAKGVSLEVETRMSSPPSFHHAQYPAVWVRVWGRAMKEGEDIVVTLGEPGGYVRGFCVLARAPEFASRGGEWEVMVDAAGNAEFTSPYYRREQLPLRLRPVESPPRTDILPASAASLRVTARSAPRGESLPVTVAAEDAFGNPAPLEGEVELYEASTREKLAALRLSEGTGRAAVGAREGAFRVAAVSWDEGLIGLSNPVSPGFFGGEEVFFGDIHCHTALSDGVGTPEESYTFARDVMGMEFCALADHEGGRDWDAHGRAVKAFYSPDEFVAILAFEHSSSGDYGHRNVYYRSDDEPCAQPPHPDGLWDLLKGRKAVVIPHHTNTHSEGGLLPGAWKPYDPGTHNPAFERLIEVCQNRGSFEVDAPSREDGVYFGGLGRSVRDLLARGMVLGFVGGTDNHAGQPGSYRSPMGGLDWREHRLCALTAVVARDLTREAVWDAVWARRTYATNGERILLRFSVNGQPMGSELPSGGNAKRLAAAKVIGTRPLRAVDLVKNGEVIASGKVSGSNGELEFADGPSLERDYYYVRVKQEGRGMAWASPVWVGG